MRKFVLLVTACVTAALIAPTAPSASAAGTVVKDATFSPVSNGWSKVERWHDTDTNFPTEAFPPDGRGDQKGDRLTYFGGVARPNSGSFLMYYAPKWQTGTKAVPVLLVHGANDDADRAWANPNAAGAGGCGVSSCPTTGLMQSLDSANYKVFALQFAHKRGDNYYQAQVIADAIGIIKAALSVTQVDVIAWSKGVISARLYAASIKTAWGRPYQNDVRKLVLIGGPNKGTDYSFRHGNAGVASVWPECGGTLNGPAASTSANCFGTVYAHPELSYSGTGTANTFPGDKQYVARWDSTYALDSSQIDYQTMYNGGQGIYTYSPGIQAVINAGSLIATIQAGTIPSSVSTYLLCGNSPTLVGLYNENTGPSDGLIFVNSCTATGGIATTTGTSTLALNHLQLGWAAAAVTQVETWLG
jgi:hypothetical protein